ncbi:hypothetical protein EV194_103122 [Natronoflexus pectinivorans]|uniref:Uncharacterized protein n=1 Tax=Natronoflexus pectinivorans TaxID=682526 RepID=A0A4R2GK44_9BACT|nr:hypothetical protein EV194_103122 [Natronoflexus pectinivorans]
MVLFKFQNVKIKSFFYLIKKNNLDIYPTASIRDTDKTPLTSFTFLINVFNI